MGFDFDPRRVLATVGLSGSGKSFVAQNLTRELGYTVLRSDEIRKILAGIDPKSSARSEFGKGIYTERMTRLVYETLLREAKKVVSGGGKVILDATFLRRWQRELLFRFFPTFYLVWVLEPEEVVLERLRRRKNDVSDADVSVYLKQKEIFEPPTETKLTFVIRSSEWKKLLDYLK